MADVALPPTAAMNDPEQALPRNPPLNQSDAIASLLSLSFAEDGIAPTNTPDFVAPVKIEQPVQLSVPTAQAVHAPSTSVPLTSSLSSGGKHHRRLSSTGKTRRRLSDAKEAANRPSPSLLQSSSAALSLASLSLSSSPPSSYPGQVSASFTGASRTLAPAPPKGVNGTVGQAGVKSNDGSGGSIPVASDDEEKNGAIPIPISSSSGRSGKKRGMDHRCETCSKIYRHPSCLIKHRWEHTPHWREASKFVLSKHQQVQLLEAAAILSHMSPAASGGRSLPEDRSLWPSFLSGGSLPPPEPPIPTNRSASGSHDSTAVHGPGRNGSTTSGGVTAPSPSYNHGHPVSSSVPARSTSTGPRLHDYGVSPGVVTQVRPGLIGVTTSSGGVAVIGERTNSTASNNASDGATVANSTNNATQPVPVPNGGRHYHDAFGSVGSNGGSYYRNHRSTAAPESWGSSQGGGLVGYPYSNGVANSNHGTSVISAGGWSLPRSSVRSGSSPGQSSQMFGRRSRSRSVSNGASRRTVSGSSESPPSDDESVDVDGMMEDGGRDRDVNVVIEEEEDEEDEEDGGTITRRKGAFVDDGKTGMHTPRNVYGGRYPPSRYGYQSTGRRLRGMDDDDDMDRDDEMDGSRMRKGPVTKREEEWDGMEMEMDMDMD